MINYAEAASIGLTVLVVIVIVMRLHSHYALILRRDGVNLDKHEWILTGPLGLVFIGGIFLLAEVFKALQEGRQWYEGLAIPFAWSADWREKHFLLLGYGVTAWGVISFFFKKFDHRNPPT